MVNRESFTDAVTIIGDLGKGFMAFLNCPELLPTFTNYLRTKPWALSTLILLPVQGKLQLLPVATSLKWMESVG